MNETDTSSKTRPTLRDALRDRRGRLDPERYRSHGAWLAYIGLGAFLLFGVPGLVYSRLVEGSLVTTGFAIAMLVVWSLYGLMTDAVLSRWFARWPTPSRSERPAMTT